MNAMHVPKPDMRWDHFGQGIENIRQNLRWDTCDLDFQHLFDNHHPEFISSPQGQIPGSPPAETRRSVYVIKWTF